MQRTKISRRFCKNCGKKTKHERHITAMGLGDFIMIIFTCGLWLIARRLEVLNSYEPSPVWGGLFFLYYHPDFIILYSLAHFFGRNYNKRH